MFIRYLNESSDRNDLETLNKEIHDLNSDISNFEKELSRYRLNNWSMSSNTDLAKELFSENKAKEFEELLAQYHEIEREISKLRSSYTDTRFIGYDRDGDKEYDTFVSDRELEKQLEPTINKLKAESGAIWKRLRELEMELKNLIDATREARKLDFNLDAKKSGLTDKQSQMKQLTQDIINKRNLNLLTDDFMEVLNSGNMLQHFTCTNQNVKFDTNGEVEFYVDVEADIDLEEVDIYDYMPDDPRDRYSFDLPDSIGEEVIAELETEIPKSFDTSLYRKLENGKWENFPATYDCQLSDSWVDNQVTVRETDDEFEISGDYKVKCTFLFTNIKIEM